MTQRKKAWRFGSCASIIPLLAILRRWGLIVKIDDPNFRIDGSRATISKVRSCGMKMPDLTAQNMPETIRQRLSQNNEEDQKGIDYFTTAFVDV